MLGDLSAVRDVGPRFLAPPLEPPFGPRQNREKLVRLAVKVLLCQTRATEEELDLAAVRLRTSCDEVEILGVVRGQRREQQPTMRLARSAAQARAQGPPPENPQAAVLVVPYACATALVSAAASTMR
ncbi:MAG: hypothetical protein ACYCSF_06655 [Acidimicrobiales bacterium]